VSPLSGELWPAHPKPLPDELLTSWIARCAKANGLKLQTFCDRVFGKERQLWNRDIDRLAPEWLLDEMTRRTGTPYDVVQHTTLDIYHGRLFRERHSAGQLRWILPMGIYHRTRRNFGMQFCPKCLEDDEDPYFRTYWRVSLITHCAKHRLCMHDRCPACNAPIVFHRRELGRPGVTDYGSLCLCHACDNDLREARHWTFTCYTKSIAKTLGKLTDYVSGVGGTLDIGHTDVLHQLCKILINTEKSFHLAAFVTNIIGVEHHPIKNNGRSFESWPVNQRAHIIQLAAWILSDPQQRITAAWQANALRYNWLVKDFPSPPSWYRSIVDPLNRGHIRKRPLTRTASR
jgi:hypothetical protein